MANKNGVKEKHEAESKNKVTRYAFSTDEKSRIQNIQSVMGILALLSDGLKGSMMMEIARVRSRVGVKHESPEGYNRMIDIDDKTWELLVIDMLIVKKDEKP